MRSSTTKKRMGASTVHSTEQWTAPHSNSTAPARCQRLAGWLFSSPPATMAGCSIPVANLLLSSRSLKKKKQKKKHIYPLQMTSSFKSTPFFLGSIHPHAPLPPPSAPSNDTHTGEQDGRTPHNSGHTHVRLQPVSLNCLPVLRIWRPSKADVTKVVRYGKPLSVDTCQRRQTLKLQKSCRCRSTRRIDSLLD